MIRELRISPEGATCKVKSRTVEDLWYIVVKSDDDNYRCQCPHNFIKGKECYHISEMQTEIARQQMVSNWGEPSLYYVVYRACTGIREYTSLTIATSATEARERIEKMYYKVTVTRVTPTYAQAVTL